MCVCLHSQPGSRIGSCTFYPLRASPITELDTPKRAGSQSRSLRRVATGCNAPRAQGASFFLPVWRELPGRDKYLFFLALTSYNLRVDKGKGWWWWVGAIKPC